MRADALQRCADRGAQLAHGMTQVGSRAERRQLDIAGHAEALEDPGHGLAVLARVDDGEREMRRGPERLDERRELDRFGTGADDHCDLRLRRAAPDAGRARCAQCNGPLLSLPATAGAGEAWCITIRQPEGVRMNTLVAIAVPRGVSSLPSEICSTPLCMASPTVSIVITSSRRKESRASPAKICSQPARTAS